MKYLTISSYHILMNIIVQQYRLNPKYFILLYVQQNSVYLQKMLAFIQWNTINSGATTQRSIVSCEAGMMAALVYFVTEAPTAGLPVRRRKSITGLTARSVVPTLETGIPRINQSVAWA